MGSTLSAIACPHCNCCATEDFFYTTEEKYIWCFRCGYSFERTIKEWKDDHTPLYLENEYKGYGMAVIVRENGKDLDIVFYRPLSNDEISEYLNMFQQEDLNLDKSYFYLYEDGSFRVLAGNPPQHFLLPFDEYEKKMAETNQLVEIIIPM